MTAVPITEAESGSFGITKRMISFGRGLIPEFKENTQVEIHWESTLVKENSSSSHSHDGLTSCSDKCSATDSLVLDDTRKHFGKTNPMRLILGRSFRLPCLEVCVKTMCVNEVAAFRISDPKLTSPYPAFAASLRSLSKQQPTRSHCCAALAQTVGYGYHDLDDLLRNPGQSIQFTIELLAVHSPGNYPPERWQMTDEERIANLEKLRLEGNRLVAAKEWRAAAALYSDALDSLDLLCSRDKPGEPEWKEFDSRKAVFYANLAHCQLQLEDFIGTIDSCSEVLRRDPSNVKAFYRRARAYAKNWENEKAFTDWAEVMKLDSALTSLVMKEASEFRQLLDAQKKVEGDRLKTAFAKLQQVSQ